MLVGARADGVCIVQGGTFIALALLFLVLGSHRYFKVRLCSRHRTGTTGLSHLLQVQTALMREPQSMFPPSRRSVFFSSFCVGKSHSQLDREEREDADRPSQNSCDRSRYLHRHPRDPVKRRTTPYTFFRSHMWLCPVVRASLCPISPFKRGIGLTGIAKQGDDRCKLRSNLLHDCFIA